MELKVVIADKTINNKSLSSIGFFHTIMRTIAFLVFAVVSTIITKAQSTRVVQLEHSLRWASEMNFPNFLKDPALEEKLLDEIGDRLASKLEVADIVFPGSMEYRLIGGFGKTKIKFPKSSGDTQVAIASSITRATYGYSILWSMKVVIRKNGKTILDKEVEHELEPYSMSIRMSPRPWMEADEFSKTFLFLLNECLGNQTYTPGTIEFGSIEIVRKEVGKIIPIANEYKLAVAGAMMADAKATYQLLKDSTVLHDFYYKDNEEWDFNLTFAPQSIFPSIFSQITGIETYYKLESKEKRFGTLTTNDGVKRRMRLDWLEELRKSAVDHQAVEGRVISPITGQFLEKDSLIAHFIVYSESRPLQNVSLRDVHFQQGSESWSETVFTIIGEFRKRPFVVTYNEAEAKVLISLEGRNVAVLSLINSNPASLSAGGVRMSKNKRFISSGNIKKQKLEVGSAEWYPFYVVENVGEQEATEMSFILMLLFFAAGQAM